MALQLYDPYKTCFLQLIQLILHLLFLAFQTFQTNHTTPLQVKFLFMNTFQLLKLLIGFSFVEKEFESNQSYTTFKTSQMLMDFQNHPQKVCRFSTFRNRFFPLVSLIIIMKYKFLRKCIISCFRSLVRLGFRERLFQTFAFFPPDQPTYVLRLIDEKESSPNNKQRSFTSLLPQIGNSSNASMYESEESFRFHRISSVITEKLNIKTTSIPSGEEETKRQEQSKQEKSPTNKVVLKKQQTKKSRMKQQKVLEYEVKLVSSKLLTPVRINVPEDMSVTGFYLRTQGLKYFACFNIEMPDSDYVMIYSHGNSPDLGIMLDSYLDLSFNLNINVFAYDYLGYGQSEDKPNDFTMIQQIIKVYQFLRYTLHYEWNKILLYGHSLGTGVSTILAAMQDYPVAGLVIHSGFMSGLRIIDPNMDFYKFDLFPNIELLEYVNCIVFIIHGMKDIQIGPNHAAAMASKCKNLFRVHYAEEGGHNDIAYNQKTRVEYFQNLREFLQMVKCKNDTLTIEEILKINRAVQWKASLASIYNYFSSRGTSQYSNENTPRQHTLNETLLSKREPSQIELYQKNYFIFTRNQSLKNTQDLEVIKTNNSRPNSFSDVSRVKRALTYQQNMQSLGQ